MPTLPLHILITIADQNLVLLDNGAVLRRYQVSTAANGPGEQLGSECTPRGRHIIRARIGAGQPANTVFVGRRPTGEIYSEDLRRLHPQRDWILTRILWLSGLEPGYNRLGVVDTMRRYIYIHGTPDSIPMGQPGSRGCIRMRNTELMELFDLVTPGTPVNIVEQGA